MNTIIKTFFSLTAIAFLTLALPSCNNDVGCSFADDQKIIEDYLANNSLTAVKRESGLHYITQEEGIGTLYPNFASIVKVKYKGYFTDGTVFDENDTGIEFSVNGVISGWQEGLTLMKKESKMQLFIPSSLAYGIQPVAGLEGRECSVLIFDVEMLDFR